MSQSVACVLVAASRSLKFSARLTIVTAIGIFVLAGMTSFLLSVQSAEIMKAAMQSQGIQIAKSLAEQSRLALITGNGANAAEAIRAALHFPGVLAVDLIDANGALVIRELEGRAWAPPEGGVDGPFGTQFDAALYENESASSWLFVAPVLTQSTNPSPFDAAVPAPGVFLGQVRVWHSSSQIAKMRRTLFVSNLSYSMLFAFVLLLVVSAMGRRLTAPLRGLSRNMAAARAGALNLRAEVEGAPDVAEMAQAFNEMVERLSERENSLIAARDDAMAFATMKAQFAAAVSHEIRTPLNGVIGTLDLLRTMSMEPRQQYFADLAWDSAQQLMDLVNSILDLSRLESGASQVAADELDLRDLVEGVIDSMTSQAHQKGLELGYSNVGSAGTSIVGDDRKIRQVLTNLIGNALKFTDRGGAHVRFGISQVGDDGNARIRFEVQDSGPGISDESKEVIFGSFVQLESGDSRQHQGSGLGLAISRQLVHLMGGVIGVLDVPEAGSLFYFEVPAKVKEPLDSIDFRTDVVERRLVVVDASVAGREFFSDQSWRRVGWVISVFSSVDEAVRSFRASMPEVILIDRGALAGPDEPEVLRRLYPGCKLAVMTPFAVPFGEKFFHAAIAKPLTFRRVLCSLESMMSSAAVEPEAPSNHRFSVLVVEDNRTNQIVALNMLESFGGVCQVASSGVEAIACCASESFDLIFMDCAMPGMDGYEATRALRDAGWEGPIVAMTANVTARDVERCMAAGMSGHLAKPFTSQQMRAAVDMWVRAGRKEIAPADGAAEPSDAPFPVVDLDLGYFRQLSDTLGRSLGDAVKMLFEDMPGYIERARSACVVGHAEELRLSVHTLCGAAGNLGLVRVAGLARMICDQCDDMAGSVARIDELEAACARAETVLRDQFADRLMDCCATRARVLVVDDDRVTRAAVRYALQLKGFAVIEMGSGRAAMEFLAMDTPDVVLLDAVMPGMDGFETCERIKLSGNRVPVMMMTSLQDKTYVERAYAVGAVDYVLKPLLLEPLVQRVSQLVASADGAQEGELPAIVDVLTGLPNRVGFLREMQRRTQQDADVGLVLIDIDRFSDINERFGHEIGGGVLKVVSDRICGAVRGQDLVARTSGDCFAVVFTWSGSGETLAVVARKVLAEVAGEAHVSGHVVGITVRAGIALGRCMDVALLLGRAERALDDARDAVDRVRVFCGEGLA